MKLSKGDLRRQKIKDKLKLFGRITVHEITETFNCSEVTARRDLDLLEKSGQILRTNGGAVYEGALSTFGREIPFLEKRFYNWKEKMAIASAAAETVEEGDVICLTGGTTTFLVAKELRQKQNITIVTNAVNIAMELADAEWIQIVLCGGVLRSKSYELCGPLTEKMIEELNISKMFLGVDGVSLEYGFTTYSEQEARIAQLFIQRSRKVFAVFDHSKIGKSSLFTIIPFEKVNGIITDLELDESLNEVCEKSEIALYTANSSNDNETGKETILDNDFSL